MNFFWNYFLQLWKGIVFHGSSGLSSKCIEKLVHLLTSFVLPQSTLAWRQSDSSSESCSRFCSHEFRWGSFPKHWNKKGWMRHGWTNEAWYAARAAGRPSWRHTTFASFISQSLFRYPCSLHLPLSLTISPTCASAISMTSNPSTGLRWCFPIVPA